MCEIEKVQILSEEFEERRVDTHRSKKEEDKMSVMICKRVTVLTAAIDVVNLQHFVCSVHYKHLVVSTTNVSSNIRLELRFCRQQFLSRPP